MDKTLQLNTVVSQEKTAMKLSGVSCNIFGMKIGERIRSARERLGISQSDVARRLGIRPQSVQAWEAGSTSPRRNHIPGLCDILGVSKQWLEFGFEIEFAGPAQKDSNVVSTTIQLRHKSVPIISWVHAGELHEAADPFPAGYADDYIQPSVSVGSHAFALKLEGNSMEPDYREGDLVIVDPDSPVFSGNFVVARKIATNEATFKKYVVDAGKHYLMPLNRQYDKIEMDHDWIIIGRVKEMRRLT